MGGSPACDHLPGYHSQHSSKLLEQDAQQTAGTALFEVLSLSCVAGLLLLCCIPPLHLLLRAVLRPIVVFHVERGFEWVLWAQRQQHPVLTTLFTWSSHTVSVAFYVTFLPAIIWVRTTPT